MNTTPDNLPPYPGPSPIPGYGPVPVEMPKKVTTLRVLLFVMGGLNTLGGLLVFAAADATTSGALKESAEFGSAPTLYAIGVIALALAAAAITLGALCRNGKNGVRIAVLVLGGLVAVNAVVSLLSGEGANGVGIALSAFLIINANSDEAKQWFNRPRF
ncbi:hypothetical protein [Streptomyces sp. NPDC096339]|uniref:hypothetical protein n=1 Tax=Streptomyces sp. NPDC096339 TaxID=3366086 RepID=UPI003800D6F8